MMRLPTNAGCANTKMVYFHYLFQFSECPLPALNLLPPGLHSYPLPIRWERQSALLSVSLFRVCFATDRFLKVGVVVPIAAILLCAFILQLR
jgi:hypothetical protein